MTQAAKKHLKVVQIHSVIGESHPMRVTIKGLGLRGPGSVVVVANTPSFRGAIKKVMHLVTVVETDETPKKRATSRAHASHHRDA